MHRRNKGLNRAALFGVNDDDAIVIGAGYEKPAIFREHHVIGIIAGADCLDYFEGLGVNHSDCVTRPV